MFLEEFLLAATLKEKIFVMQSTIDLLEKMEAKSFYMNNLMTDLQIWEKDDGLFEVTATCVEDVRIKDELKALYFIEAVTLCTEMAGSMAPGENVRFRQQLLDFARVARLGEFGPPDFEGLKRILIRKLDFMNGNPKPVPPLRWILVPFQYPSRWKPTIAKASAEELECYLRKPCRPVMPCFPRRKP